MKENQQRQRLHAPFADDAEYLQAEYAWLAVRCRRIAAERMLRDVQDDNKGVPPTTAGTRELRCRMLELKEQEREAREGIDERLDTHRRDPVAVQLGLDEICDEYGLSQKERTILLTLSIPGIGRSIAEEILGDFMSCYGGLTVEDAIRILDPSGVADWLWLRSFLRPEGGLLRENLTSLRLSGEPSCPDTFLSADVRISIPAMARITGDDGLLFETELLAPADEVGGEEE